MLTCTCGCAADAGASVGPNGGPAWADGTPLVAAAQDSERIRRRRLVDSMTNGRHALSLALRLLGTCLVRRSCLGLSAYEHDRRGCDLDGARHSASVDAGSRMTMPGRGAMLGRWQGTISAGFPAGSACCAETHRSGWRYKWGESVAQPLFRGTRAARKPLSGARDDDSFLLCLEACLVCCLTGLGDATCLS